MFGKESLGAGGSGMFWGGSWGVGAQLEFPLGWELGLAAQQGCGKGCDSSMQTSRFKGVAAPLPESQNHPGGKSPLRSSGPTINPALPELQGCEDAKNHQSCPQLPDFWEHSPEIPEFCGCSRQRCCNSPKKLDYRCFFKGAYSSRGKLSS